MASVFEVRDELWAVAEPLIPPVRTPSRQGQRPVPDRVAFNAIVFVLVTGIAWRHLPRELGCSGVTAWRRLRDWQPGWGVGAAARNAGRAPQRCGRDRLVGSGR